MRGHRRQRKRGRAWYSFERCCRGVERFCFDCKGCTYREFKATTSSCSSTGRRSYGLALCSSNYRGCVKLSADSTREIAFLAARSLSSASDEGIVDNREHAIVQWDSAPSIRVSPPIRLLRLLSRA